jgi:hypothetical protein
MSAQFSKAFFLKFVMTQRLLAQTCFLGRVNRIFTDFYRSFTVVAQAVMQESTASSVRISKGFS